MGVRRDFTCNDGDAARMTDAICDSLSAVPFAPLLIAVSIGYALGRARWRGLCLGPAGGALFVSIALGAVGVHVGEVDAGASVGQFGFCLFVYSVGFEAGPRLLSRALGGSRLRFLAVGALVNILAVLTVLPLAPWFGLDSSTAAGALAGALTSSPTFAAAAEEARNLTQISVAFALTYPFGVVGLVLVIQVLPRVLGWHAPIERDSDFAGERTARARGELGREVTRAFRVEHPGVCGTPLAEQAIPTRTGCHIVRYQRKDRFLSPDAATVLQVGDHVLASGRVDELEQFAGLVGSEIPPDEFQRRMPAPRRIVVNEENAIGRSLAELALPRRFQCLVQRVQRGEEVLEPAADLLLERGDVVELVGPRQSVRGAVAALGHIEPSAHVTNIAVYSAGILIGILLGELRLPIASVRISLGTSGGLLLAGLLLGRFRQIGPLRTEVPEAARQLVRDLGILLFISETGLRAGAAIAHGIPVDIPRVLAVGAILTLVPTVFTLLIARRVLSLQPHQALGAVAGGMTSSAALNAVRESFDDADPAVSYAAAYAAGSVLAAVAGQVVVRALA